jgi:alpha-tubulin suppressor-like RCC1 family protein
MNQEEPRMGLDVYDELSPLLRLRRRFFTSWLVLIVFAATLFWPDMTYAGQSYSDTHDLMQLNSQLNHQSDNLKAVSEIPNNHNDSQGETGRTNNTQVSLLLQGSATSAIFKGTQLAAQPGKRAMAQDSGMRVGQSKKLAAGTAHTLFIDANGALWAWGYNAQGQLGQGANSNAVIVPVQVGSATNWTAVAAGYLHSMAIKSDGTLWAWGSNSYGQLGDGSNTYRYSPVQVGSATNWVAVAGGALHSLAIKSDGTLWAWGYNLQGQLGVGDGASRNTPVQVGTATDWMTVASGSQHSLAIKSDGTLWAWGFSSYGQLGDGSTTNRYAPVQVGAASNWTAVDGGLEHSLAINNAGTLWAWGRNIKGQLGDGSNSDRSSPVQVGTAATWTALAAGIAHSLATQSNGTLWAWGSNEHGQLGDGSNTDRNAPVQVGSATSWTALAAGEYHSVGSQGSGTLWTWGNNGQGQLGDGTFSSQSNPVQMGSNTAWVVVAAGAEHSLGIQSDGTLWAWGTTTGLRPIPIGGVASWAAVAAGYSHSLGIQSDGTLWAWGDNAQGQLGDGSSTYRIAPVQAGVATNWKAVSAGQAHSLAIKSDGTLWAWGYNGQGQLGIDDASNRMSPVQVGTANDWMTVAVGYLHSLAIKNDGTLWTWGSNVIGELGDGSTTDRRIPIQVGNSTNWMAIAGGQNHSLAVRADGTLWAWGSGASGRLGNGSLDPIIQTSPAQVGLDTNWASVSAGRAHSLATKRDGSLWSWGSGDNGVLGNGNIPRSSPAVIGTNIPWAMAVAGLDHNMGILSDGTLWGWGYNFGRLGDGTLINKASPWRTVFNSTVRHTLSVTTPINGAVRSQPAVIDCGSGNTVCSTSYYLGAVIRLTAVPAANYAFTGWTGACSGSGVCSVTIDAAKSISATFVEGYALSVSKTGSGTVSSSPAGISCGASCSNGYSTGTSVALSAAPDSGSIFAGWTGACTGTGSCTVTMDEAKSVGATFTPASPAVTFDPTWLAFANQVVGNSSAAQTVTLTNTGNAALTIASVTTTDDFARTSTCGLTLAAAASCAISITFTPTAGGTRSGSLSVASDAAGSPHIVVLSGTGTALAQTVGTIGFSPATISMGGTSTASATATSGLAVSFGTTTPTICSVSGITVTGLLAGTCTITVSQAGNAIYLPAPPVTQNISVGPASQTIGTISFSPTSLSVGDPTIASATATSGLPVIFTSITSTICSVSGSTVTGLLAGTCTVATNQAGNTNYSAAPQVTQNITVGQASQTIGTITFNPSSISVGGTSTASATATSGLPVTFSSTTPTICSVSGNTVTGLTAGTCTIAADQAGNANYSAAPQVTQSITVTAAPFNTITHYYTNILNRVADDGGKAFWQSEVSRMSNLSVSPNEAYIALALNFFTSAEFLARGFGDEQFVRNLYLTFYNREADQGGLDYWRGLLSSGLPRDMIMYAFMFSTEFGNFMIQNIGATYQRPEVGAVIDYYRGAFGRLPDDGGLKYWVNQFRTAQCSGNPTAGVYTAATSIAAAFFGSAEYNNAAPSANKYISDLFNAFMRRSADLEGYNFWVSQVATGAQSKDAVRQQFVDSPEFAARVQAIAGAACTGMMQ